MTAITGTTPGTRVTGDTAASAGPGASPDPVQVYALGADPEESARLRRQSAELRPEGEALLTRVGLGPGQAAADLGCGPGGILGLLSAAVSPGGQVVGVDANPAHVAMAAECATRSGLANVEVIEGDARHTGLPGGGFDLVHARTLLVTVPKPAEVMVRLARPGGWVASQEPDCGHALCHPPLAAWDRLQEIFLAGFSRSGADPFLGRRLLELYRQAGLTAVEVMVHASTYPAGHSRRTVIPDLVRSLHPVIVERGLAGERELAELDQVVRRHLADPGTLMMPHLLVAVWGQKPTEESRSLPPLHETPGHPPGANIRLPDLRRAHHEPHHVIRLAPRGAHCAMAHHRRVRRPGRHGRHRGRPGPGGHRRRRGPGCACRGGGTAADQGEQRELVAHRRVRVRRTGLVQRRFGVVHLQGAARQTSTAGTGANRIGTLPKAARPSRNVFVIVQTFNGTYADLGIGTNGKSA